MPESSKVILNKSEINYSYVAIKMTQSRIDKGLIAIPVFLLRWFPNYGDSIQIYLDDSLTAQTKRYSPYNSSTHECRIYGMKRWFEKNKIKNGDEIVIQIIDKDKFIYRLINKANFIIKTHQIQNKFDNSSNEQEALQNLIEISNWIKATEEIVKLREFYRLIKETNVIEERKRIIRRELSTKDNTPPNIKILLGKIYAGHCQICDFWFLKKDKSPYFEIHHINPEKANYIQNLLLLCGNCHNQFHYADVRQELKEGWISKVCFNDKVFEVNQIVFKQKFEEATKEIFI